MKVSDSKNGYIKSIELLTPNRLDIVFKYLYLKFYDKSKDFADEIYNEHIKIITNGLYKEIDNGKEGIDEFHKSFLKTFNNIKEKRFNPEISVIPVTSDLSISNGAHRVASSIYLNQDSQWLCRSRRCMGGVGCHCIFLNGSLSGLQKMQNHKR